jgi:hypothetical protein
MTGNQNPAVRTRAAELHRMKYHLDAAIANLAAFDELSGIRAREPARPKRKSWPAAHIARPSQPNGAPSAA